MYSANTWIPSSVSTSTASNQAAARIASSRGCSVTPARISASTARVTLRRWSAVNRASSSSRPARAK
jgi:hypothetical protein